MTENNFHNDLVCALGEMQNPPMTSENPHFHSKFSSLKDCVNTIRPILAKHGIAVTQMVQNDEAGNRVVTRLIHKSGEYIEDGGVPLTNTNDPQKMGSSLTYARRYGLLSITGSVGDPDDDGNKASEVEPVIAQPAIKEAVPADNADDFVLHYLNARTLSFESSTEWVDAYGAEMQSFMNDKGLKAKERIKCMQQLEVKNADGLSAIPDGAAKQLREKRLSAEKRIGEK